MQRTLIAVVLLLCFISIAADAPDKPVAPKSPAAVQAIKRSNIAIKKAEADFRAAKLAVLKQLIADLKYDPFGLLHKITRTYRFGEARDRRRCPPRQYEAVGSRP
jgi:hypothetical protein